MTRRRSLRRSGIAVGSIGLVLALVVPLLVSTVLASTVGAAPARTTFVSKRRHRRVHVAVRAAKPKPNAAAVAKFRAALAKSRVAAKPAGASGAKGSAKLRRALRLRHRAARAGAARRAAPKRRNAAALGPARLRNQRSKRNKKLKAKQKPSALSLPFLAFLALLPFAFMSVFLLGADWLRRREPPQPRRRRASLEITQVRDR